MTYQTTDPRALDTSVGLDGTRYDVYGFPADSPLNTEPVELQGCSHTYAPECLCRELELDREWEEQRFMEMVADGKVILDLTPEPVEFDEDELPW